MTRCSRFSWVCEGKEQQRIASELGELVTTACHLGREDEKEARSGASPVQLCFLSCFFYPFISPPCT